MLVFYPHNFSQPVGEVIVAQIWWFNLNIFYFPLLCQILKRDFFVSYFVSNFSKVFLISNFKIVTTLI